MVEVKIYTTRICPYCVRAKKLLDARGVAYEDVNVDGDDEARDWLVEQTGRRTVPQIFIAGVPIGGCDDLYALDRAGELQAILAGERPPPSVLP